jgi:hypothetical protein
MMIINRLKESLDRYASERTPTGGFLRTVLENNLFDSVWRADDKSMDNLADIVSYIYHELPSGCHGSPEKVINWLKKGINK